MPSKGEPATGARRGWFRRREVEPTAADAVTSVRVAQAEALGAVGSIHAQAIEAFDKKVAEAGTTLESMRRLSLEIQMAAEKAAIGRIEAAGKGTLDQVAVDTGTVCRRDLAAHAIASGTLDKLMPRALHIAVDRLGALAHWVSAGQWPAKPAADSVGGADSVAAAHASSPRINRPKRRK